MERYFNRSLVFITGLIRKFKSLLALCQNYVRLTKISEKREVIEASEKILIINGGDVRIEPYYAHIILAFLIKGYHVVIWNNFKFVANLHSFVRKLIISSEKVIVTSKYPKSKDAILIEDRFSRRSGGMDYKCTVRINCDVYSRTQVTNNIVKMPFHMSPNNYINDSYKNVMAYRAHKKTIRVFFSGNTDPQQYNNQLINSFFKKAKR